MNQYFYELTHDISESFYVQLDGPFGCPPHFHRNYELAYVTEGALKVRINDTERVAEKDDIIFVHHFYSHEYNQLSSSGKIVVIPPLSSCADFESFLTARTLPPVMDDKDYNARALLPLFRQLLSNRDASLDAGIRDLLQKAALNTVFGLMLSRYETTDAYSSGSSKLISELLFYIDKEYPLPLSLPFLAEKFGYNKFYLSRLWNKHIPINLGTYINIVRTQKTVALLRENPGKISDAAFECGFDSLATFYRYFRALYKETSLKKLLAKEPQTPVNSSF